MTTNTNLDSNPTSLTAPHPSLKNRVAIVTGGVRGLGRAMAFALLQAGALVVVTGVKDSPEFRAIVTDATAQVGPGRLIAVRADVTVSSDCQAVVQQALDTFGAVHVLVNNAGLGMIGISQDFMDNTVKFWETDVADWQKIINTNVIGTFLITKAVVPHLIAQGFGRIVNISTSLSTMVRAGFSPYGPSKAAIEACSAIWANELAASGVTVNVLKPGGASNTRMITGGESESAQQSHQFLPPEVMIPPILWLASDASSTTTGQRFIAKDWDTKIAPDEAARKIGEPIQFGSTKS